jgi:hypothetical protein
LSQGTLWHSQQFLQYIKIYSAWIYPSTILLHPPISGIISTDIIFLLTYMYTQYLHHIHLPSTSPHIFSLLR